MPILKNMFIIFLLVLGLLSIAFLGIAIKILLQKNGKFSGTCASNSPFLNPDGQTCGYCGKSPEFCENKEV